jgi:hypothetical protein
MSAVTPQLHLEVDGAIATITNDNPDKHNAFDDEMDAELFAILAQLRARPEVRAVIWRGEGKSFSSGRDVGSIGTLKVELSHHELMRQGHRGIQQLWELDAPVIVACKGWVMGGSFQRALLCDVRVAAEGTRFRLPEVTYGVIPDTGGVGVLFEMCGHGVVSDTISYKEKDGGSQTKTTYSRDWSDQAIDSSQFEDPNGHENQKMPFGNAELSASHAKLGGWTLDSDTLRSTKFNYSQALMPDAPAGWTPSRWARPGPVRRAWRGSAPRRRCARRSARRLRTARGCRPAAASFRLA